MTNEFKQLTELLAQGMNFEDNAVVMTTLIDGKASYFEQGRLSDILALMAHAIHFIFEDTRKAKVKKIYCSSNNMKFVVDAELIDAKEKGIIKSFVFEDFGKTVFLTREEAEQALKEEKNHDSK